MHKLNLYISHDSLLIEADVGWVNAACFFWLMKINVFNKDYKQFQHNILLSHL